MNLQYCNGRKTYNFSTDEEFYYPGCDPKYYHLKDLSPKAFRRGYVAALFTENKHWLKAIEKCHMLVPGTRNNKRDAARDLAAKDYLQEQVSSDTYEDRKRFYETWIVASCCADDCDQQCDQCSNKNIKFDSVPTFGLDADVRRYIIKYGRYQTTSEIKETKDARDSTILSRVCDRESDNDLVWIRGQKGDGLFSEPSQVPRNQSEGVEEMLSSPIS